MIDKSEIMHNIKVGSDTDIYLARINTDNKSNKFTKVKTKDGIFSFPYLTRTTGNSLKPTTEYIQSNELRKGGAESAPRPGNTSVEGSIDVELSPDTFDDNLCSVFDNEWKPWVSDANSASNLDKVPCSDGNFLTRANKLKDPSNPSQGYDEDSYNSSETFGQRKLLSIADGDGGLIVVPAGSVVNEMTFSKKKIEYLIAKKYGGVESEDMYHIFKRLAIGTLDLNAEIGAIVTGSFGFTGDSSSPIMDESETKTYMGGATADKFEDGVTTGNAFVENLPGKATETDQFTSREGDLWINGKNITFAQSLSMNIDKNLEKKYALFVKNPISKKSLKKAITLNLSTYLVPDAKTLYNLANDNKTFEVLFAFEDKGYMNDLKADDQKPEYIYLVQIFNSKAEDRDLSASGEGDYNMSIPLRSFGERLCRVFKIALPKFNTAKAVTSSGEYNVVYTPNILLSKGELVAYDASTAPNGIKLTKKVDGGSATEVTVNIGYELLKLTESEPADWSTDYTDYYVKDGDHYSKVPVSDPAPTWEANKYYEHRIEDAAGKVSGDTGFVDPNLILDLIEDKDVSDTYAQVYFKTELTGSDTGSYEYTLSWNGKECTCNFTIA